MLRQASSRNHRSKGFKIKNALQIFLLVAICIWLLYQVKHSHEKKRAFEERNAQSMSKIVENEPDFFRFGRKDLPHIEPEETDSANEIRDRDVENEETQEEEEHETKQEDIEDEEGKDNGDEEIEQDEEKADEEAEHEEESTEEEEDKDSHDGEEDKDEKDEVDLFDNQDHEGGTQEAREENYRRDDASSAVAHESGNGDDEKNVEEDRIVNKIDDNTATNSDGSKSDVVAENTEKVAEVENATNETGGNSTNGNNLNDNEIKQSENPSSNVTDTNIKNLEQLSKPENGSISISTPAEYNSQLELQANSTAAVSDKSTVAVDVGVPVSNDSVSLNSAQGQNTSFSDDNATRENTAYTSNTTAVESKEHSTTLSSNENGDGEQGESNDSSHDVLPEEVREARTDLSTLPDIHNEAKMTEDETSE